MGLNVPVRHVGWSPCWRIIPTRYPEEKLFDRVTELKDRQTIEALERLTNERALAGAPEKDYVAAALSHRNPEGSRFSDGTFGVYYTARRLSTAIAETRFHREQFMRRTHEPPMWLEMRLLTATLSGKLHDLRGRQRSLSSVYSKTSYKASQPLAARLRAAGSLGIAYDSVRDDKRGPCAALFRADALSKCELTGHLIYEWNGEKIARVLEVAERRES